MSFSLHNSQEFNKARQEEGLQLLLHPQLPSAPKEPLAITNALTDENQSFLYQFLARTQPQDLPRHDISFQKNFLVQHIKTIEAILQNSEESILTTPKELIPAQQEVHILTSLSTHCEISLLSFLETHQLAHQLTDTDQLIKDLEKERDLQELINYFINNYPKEVAIGLVILTADIWSSVRSIKFHELQILDLQRISQEWVKLNIEKFLQRADSQALMNIFKSSKGILSQILVQENFQNRLIIFSTTLLLVVSGFFQNPYSDGQLPPLLLSEVDYPKRYSPCSSFGCQSDSQFFSDLEEEGQPQKKRKRY